jgi:hypothetical protein
MSVSRLLYNQFCLVYNHAFLPTFSKVYALPANHTNSLDVCTGPGLALVPLIDATLRTLAQSIIGVLTC